MGDGKLINNPRVLIKGFSISLVTIIASQLFLTKPNFAEHNADTEEPKENIEHKVNTPLWEEFPRRVGRDFKHIYTAPKRMRGKDWLKVGAVVGATGLLIAYDDEILDSIKCKDKIGGFPYQAKRYFGSANYVIPSLGGLYVAGSLAKSEREKETALRGLEALAIAGLTEIVIQYVTGRQRPEEGGKFKWFNFGHFPGGHTTVAFSIAPILDHQYCKIEDGDSDSERFMKYLGKVAIYGLPSAVAYHRLKTGSHYLSDVFVSIVLSLSVGNMVNKLNDKEQKDWKINTEIKKDFYGLKLTHSF